MLTNASHLYIMLDKVEAVDADGIVLAAMTVGWALENGAIPPGGAAVVLLDAALAPDAALPAQVATRITSTRRVKQDDGTFAPLPETAPVPATATFTVAGLPLGDPAIAIDTPLRGNGAVNGCCDAPVSHRTGSQAINGAIRFPERFAIDWIQLTPDGHMFTGDGSNLSDYAYYGAPVYAAADALVVSTYDGLEPQLPGKRDPNLKPADITGNSIVLDLGGGTFALYAHLLKDSILVRPGDRVTAGQELARLGNTGNSDAPHLHFQLMDGPSPLNANGLPYVLRAFASQGVLAGGVDAAFDAADQGQPVVIDPRLAGAHAAALPLNDEVVDFD